MKRLNVKARKAHNGRKLGQFLQADLKLLYMQLLAEKKDIFRSVLQNKGKFWTEFHKYVKRRKGNRENILMSKYLMTGLLLIQ